ncbi:MAG: hypothetical protein DWQ40_06175 [Actinobacteria bacterium]|nr:MAG: hypothetical protein DWQ40_06175 [Actinomycetota bacterium]REK38675.1 MAG: hypothetical protein DWQ20_03640 [Actinomycetota bacterium]
MMSEELRVLEQLRASIDRYPRSSHPEEYATLQFNLGLALAESPHGEHGDNLKLAIQAYAEALEVFDERRYPLLRGRVLTALGAAERDLGLTRIARDRFQEATRVLHGLDSPAEIGSAFNNLGLAETDLANAEEAIAAFDLALDAFSDVRYERQRAATLINRGLARAAVGSESSLQAATDDYRKALDLVEPESAPYVYGLANHSLGVALLSLPGDRTSLLSDSIRALDASLSIFTKSSYPFQHALAKNNLAVAYEEIALGDLTSQRRALARLEEALMVFDPRVNAEQWREVNANFTRVLERLEAMTGHSNRLRHFVELLAALSAPERLDLLRFRMRTYLDLPEPHRAQNLEALDQAIIEFGNDSLPALTKDWLSILMEQPHEHLEAGLASRLAAQSEVDDQFSGPSAVALEKALGHLEIIQRMRVRDLLSAMGHERPEPG